MSHPLPAEVDVLVVGAGPTGLTVANLLAAAGVRTLVVERADALNDLPRAVSLDDESMRALQAAGLLGAARRIAVEGTGTRYYGRRGRLLVDARGPIPPPLGHAVKNLIDQPEFDRVLHTALAPRESVDVRFETGLAAIEQNAGEVRATLEQCGAAAAVVRARFLLGCDGGRSTVRAALGIVMKGMSFDESWIVIDTVGDAHDERFAMHHGDPARPHVIVPGRDGRCRYEFLLLPGEDADAAAAWPFVRALLAPYRPAVREEQIVRRVVYRFHALMAERWREGRCFLLGDAAHMMPPFAGQGLNSGIRDAFNLAWKLALALDGAAGSRLLDTYELERRPHAAGMVELSKRIGRVVMTTSVPRAAVRDAAFAIARRVPPARRYLEEMRFKPDPRYASGFVVGADAGAMLPQPDVLLPSLTRARLDDVLGGGFALVAVGASEFPHLAEPLWERLRAARVRLVTDDRMPRARPGEAAVALAERIAPAGAVAALAGWVALVRPDRYVAAVFAPAEERRVAADLASLLGEASPAPAPERPVSITL